MQRKNIRKFFSIPKEIGTGLWQDFRNTSFCSPYLCLLAIAQIVLFAPSIFLMNDVGLSFIGSVGADHQSMLAAMITILEPDHLYNQMAAFHSSYYGWTYFFFSFWILLPFKIIGWMLGVPSFLTVFVGLKILHVCYGLMAAVSFYFLARKFLNEPCAAVAALLLVCGSALFRLNFMFHPENVGLLFSNLGMIYLNDFVSSSETDGATIRKNYFTTLLFLVLSTLAKPTFFLLTAPLYLALFATHQNKAGKSLKNFLGGAGSLIPESALFSFIVFFIVNPWFFIRLSYAIKRQIENIAFQSQSSLSLTTASDAFKAWLQLLSQCPFIEFSILCTALLAGYFCFIKKPDFFKRSLIIFIQCFILMDILFTMTSMRTFVVIEYLIPVTCVLILNAVIVIDGGLKLMRVNKYTAAIITLGAVAWLASGQIKNNLTALKGFYDYKDTQQYKVYQYIEASVPAGSSIAHDQLVPVPDGKGIKDYHYWQHSTEEIESVHPNYLIFDSLNKYNGRLQDGTLFLLHMIETEPYEQIKIFEEQGSKIEIWQRK